VALKDLAEGLEKEEEEEIIKSMIADDEEDDDEEGFVDMRKDMAEEEIEELEKSVQPVKFVHVKVCLLSYNYIFLTVT
jgi:hypothetical protein